jgi:hypothetical protein
MIIDSYSAAQYSGYFGRMTEAEILSGIKAAREERLRLREIQERKRVEFERELRRTKADERYEEKIPVGISAKLKAAREESLIAEEVIERIQERRGIIRDDKLGKYINFRA